ncbi:hypothetical protein [Deinococcus sp. SL84]|uniref:hypothetical protein n=1 Tax=Deinococcus sp. SL84 TaxID=2994663 RepID=UPI002275D479|nr:hypothetical protein [Deinococcus sp. SL84]MCY1703565.1 hypothetical protein [Deinococcus sp. SL84]
MNHLATFTLGFLVGSLTLNTFNRRQENIEIERLEAWAEAKAGSSWDGEDPLPAELFRPATFNADDTLAQEAAAEVHRVNEQDMEDIRKRAAAQVLFSQPQAVLGRLDRDILIIEGTGKTPQQITDEIKQRVSERMSELVGEQRQPATPEPGDKN